MKKLTIFLIAVMTCLGIYAQDVTVTGTVVASTDGEPLIGATVMVKGSSTGTATDIDGKFTIQAKKGSSLLVSYVGYKSQEVKVNGPMTDVKVSLMEDSEVLDDVVVVGYGTQKKSVVTAAISKVSEKEISQTAPVRVEDALKGLTAGVTVTTPNGQPGHSNQIRVRGVGTINNSNPLYIVDGMPIEGGLDYLNPSDIQSIEVLKDAASGAVYGARAANGVVLVTTKKGKEGRAKVTYDFSYGWQSVGKKVQVLNGAQYMMMKQEGYLNAGQSIPSHVQGDPWSQGEGYDWEKAIFNDNAPVMNHQVSVAGGTEKVNYYLSLGYYKQDGIMGGNYNQSNYDRLTLRSNNTYTLFDDSNKRSYLNKLVLTTNLAYSRIHSVGFGGGGGYYGGAITNALGMSPLLTPTLEPGSDMYNQQMAFYAANSNYVPRYDANGNLYTVPEAFGGGYQELTNPLQGWSYPAEKNWSHKIVANFNAELQIWDAIKYRISFGGDFGFWGNRGHNEAAYFSNLNYRSADQASAWDNWNKGWTWQLENVITYEKTFAEDHNLSVVLGQTAKEATGWWINASANKLMNLDKPYVDTALAQPNSGKDGESRTGNAGPNNAWPRLASYFGRLSYDYANRYMLQVTVRRDGSSRFGINNKWATFPSVSAGWNFTNESFLAGKAPWLTAGKLRLSWGKNGNENIGDFRYTVLTNGGNNYYFGPEGSPQTYGSKASGLANPDLKWEESEQYDAGLDFGFMNNSLQFTVDYYYKKTIGMLMEMQIPNYVGESLPIGNVGKMSNQGVEMELRWNSRFGEFNVNLAGNLSWMKNKLIYLGNANGWATAQSNATAGDIARYADGEVFPYFYGFKTGGVFQNQAQADEYNQKYNLTEANTEYYARPGDLIFLDTNGDGTINADDRTKLGKGLPDWTYGFHFGVDWKGLSLTGYFQGVWGNEVYDASLRGDTPAKNLPAWMLNRWTGEGSTNQYPIYRLSDQHNYKSSDLYVHNGAYLRLANLTLSYTLPTQWVNKLGLSNFRLFVMGENFFTATKYHGFTPEVGDGTAIGIDYGNYPVARTWTVGFNVSL
ncbi:MAG: TonB-dependent receptor [Muribaculaceae bacterium]|nr:TonB-dependent receptor [Muribaculaceae bacterium]